VQKRRAKNHYLNEEMIRKLENASFTQRNYTIAKDLALLQFYFCGLDFVDLVHLKREQIHADRIYISRNKLGDRGYEFDMKIFAKARAIMEKYEGEDDTYYFYFPKMYNYETWRTRMYRALQQVKKQLSLEMKPKDGSFTLKIMRHSFATLGKFKRIEEDLLRELMGHERSDIDTVYKDKYPQEDRDAAQLEIIRL
jgi:integrase